MMFVTALPVKRVIFISPRRTASYQAASEARQKPFRGSSACGALVKGTVELLANREALRREPGGRLPAAVDNMSPSNPFIKTLDHPHRPRVAAHSIIPVKAPGPSRRATTAS